MLTLSLTFVFLSAITVLVRFLRLRLWDRLPKQQLFQYLGVLVLGYKSEWEEFLESLVRDLTPALKRRLYMAKLERLRGLGPPSDKLVYLYLVVAEPQSFVGIWRGLSLSVKTVDRALRRLKEGGYVVQDRTYLYWVEGLA